MLFFREPPVNERDEDIICRIIFCSGGHTQASCIILANIRFLKFRKGLEPVDGSIVADQGSITDRIGLVAKKWREFSANAILASFRMFFPRMFWTTNAVCCIDTAILSMKIPKRKMLIAKQKKKDSAQ